MDTESCISEIIVYQEKHVCPFQTNIQTTHITAYSNSDDDKNTLSTPEKKKCNMFLTNTFLYTCSCQQLYCLNIKSNVND